MLSRIALFLIAPSLATHTLASRLPCSPSVLTLLFLPPPPRASACLRAPPRASSQVVKLLIGNKDDQPDRKCVNTDIAREFAKDHNMLFMEASAMSGVHVNAAFKLLVAEVMHQADTIASQPPAFEHKLKVNAERSRRASQNCGGSNCMKM